MIIELLLNSQPTTEVLKNYYQQTNPIIVPTGNDKLIEEHFGNVSMKYEGCSIARMEAPAQWKEPAQKPEFDEVIMVMKGKMMVKVDGEKIVVKAGHSMLIKRGSKVRYSNPFDQHSEYWSICLPPFSLSTVHRD